MDEINHRTKIKLQCQCFLNGDAVFVCFFKILCCYGVDSPPMTPSDRNMACSQIRNDRIYSPERASLINHYFHGVVVIKLIVFSVSAPT